MKSAYKILVSIIVPIYNVERYIAQCIDSLVGQSHTNLEIILVDDGSDDKSGKIADGYTKKDKRIRVIHQKNGGRSAARNAAINASKGDYIALVDGDDFIANTYIEDMVAVIAKTGVSAVSTSLIKYFEGDVIKRDRSDDSSCATYSSRDALKSMLYMNGVTNSAGGKIYKKELFNGVEYPVEHNYEDLATTYRLFCNADRIAVIGSVGYYYRQNPSGIMRTKFHKRRMDGLVHAKEEMEYLATRYAQDMGVITAARYRYYMEAVFICLDILKVGIDDNNKVFYNKCADIVRRYKWRFVLDFNQTKKWLVKNIMMCVMGNKLAFRIINRMTR